MSFQAEAKRIVLVSDAPCHGSKFNDGGGDMTYRVQIEQSPDICAQMREMVKRGFDFTFIEIQPTYTAKMVALLQEAFGSAEIQDGFEREFKTVHLSDASDVVRFASVVRSSASASIAASKGRSLISSSKIAMGVSTYRHYGPTGRLTTRLPHVLEEGEDNESEEKEPVKTSSGDHLEMKTLNWSEVDSSPGIEAVRHSLHFRPNEDIDWKKLDLKHTQQETRIRLDRNCFAKGAMRSAHAMFDCNMEQYFVAKVYYGKAASVANAKSLKSDVEMQIVAKQLATEFSLSDKVENAVDFIFTCWYEIKKNIAAGLRPAMSLFTAEPYIKGEYKKYNNNNNGWINDDGLDLSDTAQAFSHFTWQKTYRQLMVVDLQGVGCIFTDPQIHSKQGEKFGCGNLSDAGMAAFFVTHKCNEVCRALRLMPAKRLKSGSKTASTSEIVETKEESAKKAANKSMTCSCPLCVGITTVLHIDFIEAHRKGREIYCEACVVKKDKDETRVCCLCKKEMSFSPYWYSMKGMEPPTSCKPVKPMLPRPKSERASQRPRPVKP